MDEPVYHVLLEGGRVGPYDRRTIVGMRIKKALKNGDIVVDGAGTQRTVADLVRQREVDVDFDLDASRGGTRSVVQATYTAALADSAGPGMTLPVFQGEVEVRVQTRVLRLAGRFREGLRWKEDRVKIPLQDLVHTRVRGSLVDLALRNAPKGPLHTLTLELFTPETAGEFAGFLPALPDWPLIVPGSRPAGTHPLLWAAVAGTLVVVGGLLAWVLSHR